MPENPPTTWISRPNPRLYSPENIARYKKWVVNYSHRFAWRLDNTQLQDLYLRNVTDRHLEIGPADLHFLDRTPAPTMDHLWAVHVMDINSSPLDTARERLAGRATVTTHEHDILAAPWPLEEQAVDSIACGNVLHCLPGNGFQDKETVFREMARVLSDEGTAWGYTLLGVRDPAISPNPLARYLMHRYNRADNIFHNVDDRLSSLKNELACFTHVTLRVMGCAAVWEARGPRR